MSVVDRGRDGNGTTGSSRIPGSVGTPAEPVYNIEQYDPASQTWKPWSPLEWAYKSKEQAESSLPNRVRPSRYEQRVSWPGVVTALQEAIRPMLRGEWGRRVGMDASPISPTRCSPLSST